MLVQCGPGVGASPMPFGCGAHPAWGCCRATSTGVICLYPPYPSPGRLAGRADSSLQQPHGSQAGCRHRPGSQSTAPAPSGSQKRLELGTRSELGTSSRGKSKTSRYDLPCSAAARRCQPSAVPKLPSALWAAPMFCSSAAALCCSGPDARALSKLSAARVKMWSWE